MFHKTLSVLLCACMVATSVPHTAYAMNSDTGIRSEIVAETATEETTEQVTEGAAQESVAGEEVFSTEEVSSEMEQVTEAAETETSVMEESLENATQDTTESVTESVIEETVQESSEVVTEVATEETLEETLEVTTEISTEVGTEISTEEPVPSVDKEIVGAAAEDIELSLDATVDVSLEYGSSNAKWLVFTAQEDGYYSIKVEKNAAPGSVYVYAYNDRDSYDYEYWYVTSEKYDVRKIAAGESLYLECYTYEEEGMTFTVTVEELETVGFSINEEGVYVAQGTNGTVQIKPQAYYTSVDFSAVILPPEGETFSDYEMDLVYMCPQFQSKYTQTVYGYDDYSKKSMKTDLSKNTTYNVDVVWRNESGKVMGVFTGLSVKTLDTQEPFVFNIEKITHNAIEFTYERLNSNLTMYYAAVDEGTESYLYTSSGNCRSSITGLKPDTAYRIWAEDQDGHVYYEKQFTTKSFTAEISYEFTARVSSVDLMYEVTGYTGNSSNLYIWYEYSDREGNVTRDYNTCSVSMDEETGILSGSGYSIITGLKAATTYTIDIWVQEEYASTPLKKVTKEFTTQEGLWKVADISFLAEQNADTPTTLDYTVTVPQAVENDVWLEVYYREKGITGSWKSSSYKYISAGTTTCTGTIANLIEGQEYELRMLMETEGLEKKLEISMGEALYSPQVSDDTDVFQTNLSYAVPTEQMTAEDTWTVDLSMYTPKYERTSQLQSDMLLSEENGYALQVNTGALQVTLESDTDYEFRWKLYKNGTLCHTLVQTIKTGEFAVSAEVISVGMDKASIEISTTAKLEDLSYNHWVSINIRPKGGAYDLADEVYFNGSSGNTVPVILYNLQENTEYEAVLRYNGINGAQCGSFTFTTLKDDRALTVSTINPDLHSIDFTVSLTGENLPEETYILYFIREKGEENWERYTQRVYGVDEYQYSISYYKNQSLKEDTTYEYVIGIGSSSSTSMEFLKQRNAGEQKTLVDDRQLQTVSVVAAADQIAFGVELTGTMAEDRTNYIVGYYRKKGTEDDWKREYNYIFEAGDTTLYFSELDETTTYEYTIGIGDTSYTEIDKLKSTINGEATTATDDRELIVGEITEKLNQVSIQFNITGEAAEGIYNYIHVYYREQGTDQTWLHTYTSIYNGGERAIGFSNLKQNTTYEYVIGIGDSWSTEKENLKKTYANVATTKEDDRQLLVNNITALADKVNMEIEVTGEAAEGIYNYVYVYYREQGTENDWVSDYTSVYGAQMDEFYIYDLTPATTYEYVVGMSNSYGTSMEELLFVKNGQFVTLVEDRELTVKSVDPSLKQVEVEIELTGQAAAGENYVRFFYREKGTEEWESNYRYVYGEQNTSLVFDDLKEATAYEYVIGIGRDWSTPKEELLKTSNGEFTTLTDDRSLTVTGMDCFLERVEFSLNLSGAAAKGDNYVYLFYREKGTEDNWEYQNTYRSQAETFTIYLYNLKRETTYEYVLGISEDWGDDKENLKCVTESEFSTLADDRTVSATVDPFLHSAQVYVTVSGNAAERMGNLCVLYYKEKGTDVEDYVAYECYGAGIVGLYLSELNDLPLKEDTEYEYVLGIAKDYDYTKENLEKAIEGQFRTLKDTRVLAVENSVGYESVNFNMNMSGNSTGISSYANIFYSPKGEDQWTGVYNLYMGYSVSGGRTHTIGNLKQGTEYEYVILLGEYGMDYSPDSEIKAEQKVEGTFKTNAADYTLSFTTDEAKSTYSKEVMTVVANGTNQDQNLYVTLTLSDNTTKEIVLSRTLGYKGLVFFTGLVPSTAYQVVRADIRVNEYQSRIQVQTVYPEFSFTTKEAVEPTKLTLSKENIALNVAEDGAYVKYWPLTLTATPEKSHAQVVWSSSNESVATVSDGIVTAVSPGTAEITATSVYDEKVKAVCSVVVENYVVAKASEEENAIAQQVTDTLYVYKGDSISGLGLYEVGEDNALTFTEGYTVSAGRSNVVKWNGTTKLLQATAVGTSYVYFEKDGVKASIRVNVLNKAKGYGVVGVSASDERYPAIRTKENCYEIALAQGVSYTAIGEITPIQEFIADEFIWTSSNEAIATVSAGVITPVSAGSVTITVKPNAETSPYAQNNVEFTLEIKELPAGGDSRPVVYALTNMAPILEDIEFPSEWEEGWKWYYPQTPLYSLPVNQECYSFEAYYDGDRFYSCRRYIDVYLTTITGAHAQEVNGKHNQVIQVGVEGSNVADSIELKAYATYTGTGNPYVKTTIPQIDGLRIEWMEETETYRITAQKEGTYVLQPTATYVKTNEAGEVVQEAVIMTGSYKLQAVENAQVNSITFSSEAEGLVSGEEGLICLDYTDDWKNKTFTVDAAVLDKEGNPLQTAIEWKTSDKTVATIKYNKNASHQATVTVKNSGNVTLMVKAKDASAYTTQLNLEFRDNRPRVEVSKLNINLAYDYDSYEGRRLAIRSTGGTEITAVYGDAVESVALYKEYTEESKVIEPNIYMTPDYNSSKKNYYMAVPRENTIPTGDYKCQLVVTTALGSEPYVYPVTIKVSKKVPVIKAKATSKVNLFYTAGQGELNLTMTDKNCAATYVGVENLIWTDESAQSGNGFALTSSWGNYYSNGKCVYGIRVSQQDVIVANKKPVDQGVAKGTLTVKLEGILDEIQVKDVKIGYNYKKPSLCTRSSKTYVCPEIGNVNTIFTIENKNSGQYLYKGTGTASYYYKEIISDNEYVDTVVYNSSNTVYATYNSNSKREKITYTLISDNWREPLEVKHTIEVAKPKAFLANSYMIYNKANKSENNAIIQLTKNPYLPGLQDVYVEGVNAKAKKLVESDIFEIAPDDNTTSYVTVRLNKTKLMKLEEANQLKKGNYKFKLTPYYRNAKTGERTALNTLVLTLKVVDKPVTVKVKTKGAIDIAKSTNMSLDENSISVRPTFSNLGNGYRITGAKLKGEYSDYFSIQRYVYTGDYNYSPSNYYYIKYKDVGKLKAGQTYKLSVEYTVETTSGDVFTVESNVFKVKPKQMAPKLYISENNQTLYASAKELSRDYTIYASSNYYEIEDAHGLLDCNKDGKADLIVTVRSCVENRAELEVSILDSHAVTATAKGKTYNIPITVKLRGRDGVHKDAQIKIKVKVKK